MDTGKKQGTSIGKKSTAIQALASALEQAEKPLQAVQTKSVNDSSLKALAELLSLIQEDCRRYNELLAPYLSGHLPVFMRFQGDGIIYISAPPSHVLGTGNGHITLDGKPVTGWGDTGTEALAEGLEDK